MIKSDVLTFGGGGESAVIKCTGDVLSTDTVVATKGSKSVNGKWKTRTVPILPSGYTELEYIESNNTSFNSSNPYNTSGQYINTGYTNTNGYAVDITFEYASDVPSGTWQVLCGAGASWSNGAGSYSICINLSTNRNSSGSTAVNTSSGDTRLFGRSIPLGEKHNIKFSAVSGCRWFQVDDDTIASDTASVGLVNYPLQINGMWYTNSSNTHWQSNCKFGVIKIYEPTSTVGVLDGTLVRHYIPCKRNSDNSAGMYDLVTGSFYGNSGVGSFIAGPEQTTYKTENYFEITPITEFDTWTVTATRGTKTSIYSVNVDSLDDYDVTVAYILYLYNEGDECESVTGDYDTSAHIGLNSDYPWQSNPIFNTSNIQFTYGSAYKTMWSICTTNSIDLTAYSSLKAIGYYGSESDMEVTADISSLTTSGYLVIYRLNSAGSGYGSYASIGLISQKGYVQTYSLVTKSFGDIKTTNFYLKKVWLE